MTPLSRLLEQADVAANQFLDSVEASTRRVRRRDRTRFLLFLAGTLVSTACTARFIELDLPWWVITFGALTTAFWAVNATRWRGYLRKADEVLSEVRTARDGMAANELREFLASTRHATPDDAPAGEPDANPKPEAATS